MTVMTEIAEGASPAETLAAPAAATSAGSGGPGFGSFRFWFATQRWEWSPEVYVMHGYVPGQIEPSTEVLLAHKHPEDRAQVAEAITRSLTSGEPFSSRHRFIDTSGREHPVMLISDSIMGPDGAVVGTSGYYIDLTETVAAAERDTLQTVLPEVVQYRAVIEQAKGALMRTYRINADQAFNVLRWRSQETNVKLRDLAQALIDELDLLPALPANAVTAVDHLLLTLHERMPHEQ